MATLKVAVPERLLPEVQALLGCGIPPKVTDRSDVWLPTTVRVVFEPDRRMRLIFRTIGPVVIFENSIQNGIWSRHFMGFLHEHYIQLPLFVKGQKGCFVLDADERGYTNAKLKDGSVHNLAVVADEWVAVFDLLKQHV